MTAQQTASVQRWLQAHCENAPHVVGGLVVAHHAGGPAQCVAEWPAGGRMTAPLTAAAQAATQRARPVVVTPARGTPDAAPHRVISWPLRRGTDTLGAVALAVQAADGPAVAAMLQALEQASADVGDDLRAPADAEPPTPAAEPPSDIALQVLHLQDTLLRQATLADSALVLTTDLAALLGSDRVALGLIDTDRLQVLALSGSAEFKGEQDLLRLIAEAMQEAADQGARVVYPAPAHEPARIVLAHAELQARSGQTLASVPLVHQGRAVGALMAQWPAAAPPTAAQLALLDSVACMLGPVLALSQRAERSWQARAADRLRAGWQRLVRRDDPLPALVLAGGVLALAALAWLPLTHRVGAPARLEGAVQRIVAAPMDGFLHKSHVRPGDTVRAGDLLVEMADQDLTLDQRRWEDALTQQENHLSAALSRADRAQFVIAQGKAGEARAQLELVRQQLARARLLAPMDGVVIQGDLGQALGAPIQRGDALLTLAPAERYRLIVEVDERDIADIRAGQPGQLALAALPGQTLPFVVERVTPVATVREGRNSFAVEARLSGAPALLRPGLQGVAKIDAGQQSAGWIWGHGVVDWLRLRLWAWTP